MLNMVFDNSSYFTNYHDRVIKCYFIVTLLQSLVFFICAMLLSIMILVDKDVKAAILKAISIS